MKISFYILFLSFFQTVFAQNPCGFDSVDSLHSKDNHAVFERLLQQRQQRTTELEEGSFYLIPVVVHVIHSNSSDEIGLGRNISDEQIFSAIEVLNEDFRRKNADTVYTPSWAKPVAADMQVEFRLATQDPIGNPSDGITRHKSAKTSYSISNESEKELKAIEYWPSSQYLNIWIANLSGNVVGYAQFPDSSSVIGVDTYNGGALTDGIVLAPFAFGRLTGLANGLNNPYRFGRTTVHEVGHWLGLRHIFNNNSNGCNYTDYCDDTPPQDKSSLSEDDPEAVLIGGCGEVILHQNYMDYSNDISMNIFTNDQKIRAHKAMEISPRRAALKYSKGLCGSSVQFTLPFTENFEEEESILENWEQKTSDGEYFDWFLENDRINTGNFGVITNDSVELKSGAVFYSKEASLVMSLNIESDGLDSIKIYYERSCSGNRVLLSKINLNSLEPNDFKLNLKGLTEDGLLHFYIVAYNNGNEVSIDNIQIYEESSTLEFVLYPNPNEGYVNIDLRLPTDQNLKFEVYNDIGKRVVLENWENVHSSILNLDLSFLEAGFYIAKLTGDTENVNFRFVIQ